MCMKSSSSWTTLHFCHIYLQYPIHLAESSNIVVPVLRHEYFEDKLVDLLAEKAFFVVQDGTVSTLTGSCTVVRDFTDLCVHSYCDYLDDFRSSEPKDGKPLDVK